MITDDNMETNLVAMVAVKANSVKPLRQCRGKKPVEFIFFGLEAVYTMSIFFHLADDEVYLVVTI
jgi:hypothetical protein